MLNALMWLVKSGAVWEDSPGRHGPWKMLNDILYTMAGGARVLQRMAKRMKPPSEVDDIWRTEKRTYISDRAGFADETMYMLDNSKIKGHQQAIRDEKGALLMLKTTPSNHKNECFSRKWVAVSTN